MTYLSVRGLKEACVSLVKLSESGFVVPSAATVFRGGGQNELEQPPRELAHRLLGTEKSRRTLPKALNTQPCPRPLDHYETAGSCSQRGSGSIILGINTSHILWGSSFLSPLLHPTLLSLLPQARTVPQRTNAQHFYSLPSQINNIIQDEVHSCCCLHGFRYRSLCSGHS